MEITFEKLPQAVSELANDISEIKRLLLAQSNETQSEPDQLLTIQQAAELLNLSVPTVYSHVSRGTIPVCKRTKRLYFSKQELLNWIKEGRRLTIDEANAEADRYMTSGKTGGRL